MSVKKSDTSGANANGSEAQFPDALLRLAQLLSAFRHSYQ